MSYRCCVMQKWLSLSSPAVADSMSIQTTSQYLPSSSLHSFIFSSSFIIIYTLLYTFLHFAWLLQTVVFLCELDYNNWNYLLLLKCLINDYISTLSCIIAVRLRRSAKLKCEPVKQWHPYATFLENRKNKKLKISVPPSTRNWKQLFRFRNLIRVCANWWLRVKRI